MRTSLFLRIVSTSAIAAAVLSWSSPALAQEEGEKDPVFGSYTWRQIGPANMSGRVADVEGIPGSATFYVAAAAGGLWKTENNGTTWKQVFQGGKTAAVGEIAIAPSDPNRLYVGMGEPHGRNSVSWGDGVWRSDDGGATWKHVGLDDTGSIGRIAVDPRNPDHVYVAALGNLWTLESDRGLYESTDGGENWTLLKGFDDGTGFYDVQIDASNPDIIYATSWWRLRRPWVFTSGGGDGNAGIWKSTDAGATWVRLEGNGLPPTEDMGKSSIVIFPGDTQILYARIEHFAADPDAPEQTEQEGRPGRRSSPNLGGTYRSTDGGGTWERIDRRNSRPFYYNQLRVDPTDPNTVYLIESALYKMNVEEQRKVVDDYELSSDDDPIENITGAHHVDFHAMWIDPTNPSRLIVGSDGGVGISWDGGETWDSIKNLPIGQFYAVGYDMAEPYNVYGGLQDNGTWGGPHMVPSRGGILNRHWRFFVGGDGFHAQVDPEDPDLILYAESQQGNITRMNTRTGVSRAIKPRVPRRSTGEMTEAQRRFLQQRGGSRTNIVNLPEEGLELRWNWSTPIVLSPHNPKTLFVGGNYLFMSIDRGDTWRVISPDLTTNDAEKYEARNRGDFQTGAENYSTIVTISESPKVPGVLWVGTDDGRVHFTKDGGVNWTEVTGNFPGVPENTWVSRVRASAFELGRAYVTFDGHRMADMTTYVFRTDDFGQSWTRITEGLPADDPAYVITEDPVNENLLYLGTESGVWASLDRGDHWVRFSNDLPIVPVHDLVVHERDRDLIIATHGLSLWVMEDVSGLQSLTPEVMEKDFELFDSRPAVSWNIGFEQVFPGNKFFAGRNPPMALRVNYWVGKAVDNVKITIESIDGTVLRELEGPGTRGLQTVDLPLRPQFGRRFGAGRPQRQAEGRRTPNRPLPVGQHRLTIAYGDETFTRVIEIRPDPRQAGRD